MGLKQLLADLTGTEGFKQKSFSYDHHLDGDTIYNDSAQPFITYGFDGKNNVIKVEDYKTRELAVELDSVAGDLIRGGAVLATERRHIDYERIDRFFDTPAGEIFLDKQVGLQLSNPRVDAPMMGILDNLLGGGFGVGLNNQPPDPNQTEYNKSHILNKTKIQSGLSGVLNSGQGAAREGLIPFVHFGYYNNFFDRNGAPRDTGMSNIDKNRLVHLGEHIGHVDTSTSFMDRISKPEEDVLLGKGLGKLNDLASAVNKGLMWLGGGGTELFSYLGGPDSIYGIGTTIHRRWIDTTRDERRDIQWPSQGDLAYKQSRKGWSMRAGDDTVFSDRGLGIKNYLNSLGKPGFIYDKFANKDEQRTYHRESRIGLGEPSRKPLSTFSMDASGHLNYNTYDERSIDKINALDIVRNEGGDLTDNRYRDMIRFRIEAIDSNEPEKSDVMVFRAFLDNFDDNYKANYNEFQYNGRGESFYTYNGFNRDLNISFKIAAQTRWEMMPLYRKLNFLVSNTAPDYHPQSGRMRTPFVRLTVGSYLNRTPGILNTINLQWQKDYPWEIAIDNPESGNDKHMLVLPHVLDVTMQYTAIHNFIPQKSITESPFILPHYDGRDGYLGEERKWLKHPAGTLDEASSKNRFVQPIEPNVVLIQGQTPDIDDIEGGYYDEVMPKGGGHLSKRDF